jgi:hypothetical protein
LANLTLSVNWKLWLENLQWIKTNFILILCSIKISRE